MPSNLKTRFTLCLSEQDSETRSEPGDAYEPPAQRPGSLRTARPGDIHATDQAIVFTLSPQAGRAFGHGGSLWGNRVSGHNAENEKAACKQP